MTSPSFSDSGEPCSTCGGALIERPLRPYPSILQTIFGVSFVAFLLLADRVRSHPQALWLWTALQLVLGVFLVRARKQAKKTVLRCNRCHQAVR